MVRDTHNGYDQRAAGRSLRCRQSVQGMSSILIGPDQLTDTCIAIEAQTMSFAPLSSRTWMLHNSFLIYVCTYSYSS